MLYGSTELQNSFIKDMLDYAEMKNFKVIYAALVGSVSRGTQFVDSDYDTRVLYLDNNHPKKIFLPWENKEDFLKHRFYTNESGDVNGKKYEWIPFWEATSFFQFLNRPAFDNKDSNGLYNVVGWTMESPYVWDPYGLQTKLKPFIDEAFQSKHQVDYMKSEIEKYWTHTDKIILKYYIRAIYSALSIKWIEKNKTFNPAYLPTLIDSLCDEVLANKIYNLIELGYKNSVLYCDSNTSVHAESGLHIFITHDTVIDDYILNSLKVDSNIIEKSSYIVNKALSNIYHILDISINDYAIKHY